MICGRHGQLLCRVPACGAQEQHQVEVANAQADARDHYRRQRAAGDTNTEERPMSTCKARNRADCRTRDCAQHRRAATSSSSDGGDAWLTEIVPGSYDSGSSSSSSCDTSSSSSSSSSYDSGSSSSDCGGSY